MNFSFKKTTCRALVASLLVLSFQSAQAGLIGAEQAAAGTMSQERAMVLASLDRSEVVAQLQQAGIDPLSARERVRAMSDHEVHALAQDINTAPAAGDSGWGIVAVILIAAAVWYFVIRR
jgi:hypothetical protein